MEPESSETGGAITAVAFELPRGDPAAAPPKEVRIPRRIRRRFLEAKGGAHTPSSADEIEAKLRDAGRRRQQFHEWVSTKAKLKPRSPLWPYQEEHISQRLEAKLYAAEQKRLSLLEKARMRLAKLDELRQAAKTGVEIRYEKEREELGTRVESRVQQAEANRMRLLKDHMQKRAAAQERTARSLKQRMAREKRYKECIQSAIFQKRVAAEKKRMRLLEEEKKRVHARVMQVRRAAKTVYSQRENERRRMRERLESRLQRAKQRRAEYLRRRGSPHSSAYTIWNKYGDYLSRKLARCWRKFVKSRRTTFDLAKSFMALGISEKSAKSMQFEQLAQLMESAATLQAVKALLERLELRFSLFQLSCSSIPENIDHLLKHISSPTKRKSPGRGARTTRGVTIRESSSEHNSFEANKPSRYSVRVVLCAYMIVGHPNAVFSGQGEREASLKESAASFVRELDLLMKILLDDQSMRKSSPDHTSDGCDFHQELSSRLPSQRSFRSHLSSFDAAWRSYLHSFVVWKVKDARSLEDDLVRAACQLELSMMQTCKLTSDGHTCEVTHDMRAIQKQVTEDQKLLRDKVQHLSGSAGIERLDSALSDTRSKFFEAKDKEGTPVLGRRLQLSSASSPSSSSSSVQALKTVSEEHASENSGKFNHMSQSLSGSASSFPPEVALKSQGLDAPSSNTNGKQLPSENEFLVNEIVHGGHGTPVDTQRTNIKAKVKETLEKVFWEGIMDSLKEDSSNYGQILSLVKEVRDELCGMSPHNWKQEILDSIDIDILSQLLKSGIQDMDYLGRILEYALLMLRKLSAPAKEIVMKKAHDNLLKELTYISHSDNEGKHSFIIAIVRGLRFALEEIQTLKTEISKARIQMLEPIIKGSAGLEYLQKAFSDRYGPASGVANSLPLTVQWISLLRRISEEEWNEHHDSVAVTSPSHGLPIGTTLRTGNSSISLAQNNGSQREIGDEDQLECKGEKLDLLLRIGVLKLASGVEGLTIQTVPETLELNVLRLRSVQSQLQQIIVISTSMLVLRQVLLSENYALSPSDIDNAISDSLKRIVEHLETVPDVGIEEIIDSIVTGSSFEPELRSRKDMIARVLRKSLQCNDAVFVKVSRSVYLAARAVVLGGAGNKGRKLAEATLRRVGAVMLLDQVVKAAKILIVVATVSGIVHAPWYRSLV